MTSQGLLTSLILLPLFGALLSLLAGKVQRRLAGCFATIAVGLSFLLSVLLFNQVKPGAPVVNAVYTWIAAGELTVRFLLTYDALTAVMCLVITGIGTLIHLYSIGYMAEDESQPRYFAYLNLFVAAMLTLVLGGSLPVVFIGWEGVGLCSYLLIGFWFDKRAYAEAGKKAFVMNRIGDLGFLVATFLAFTVVGSVEISAINTWATSSSAQLGVIVAMAACFFIAATGKSAQFPLFTWLPDAMAGPTPVSALIHAATMVTAGVYLCARLAPLFTAAPQVSAIIMVVALATAFVAATIALVQTDIKKVLAYSTVSQLGFMFMAVGSGAYAIAMFHVVTHAFFKACLFLSAGSVIHGSHHEQDMRHLGGLGKLMPFTAICYGISTLAIAGIWPFAGYFSKHAILGAIETTTNPLLVPYAHQIVWVATVIAGLTALYMARSFALTFLGRYRGHQHPHEVGIVMLVPVILLAALAAAGGYYLQHIFFEFLSPVLGHAAFHEESTAGAHAVGSLPGIIGLVIGISIFCWARSFAGKIYQLLRPLSSLVAARYLLDEVYHLLVVAPLNRLSGFLWRRADEGMVSASMNGVGYVTEATAEVARKIQSGHIAHYVFFMWFALVIMLGMYLLP